MAWLICLRTDPLTDSGSQWGVLFTGWVAGVQGMDCRCAEDRTAGVQGVDCRCAGAGQQMCRGMTAGMQRTGQQVCRGELQVCKGVTASVQGWTAGVQGWDSRCAGVGQQVCRGGQQVCVGGSRCAQRVDCRCAGGGWDCGYTEPQEEVRWPCLCPCSVSHHKSQELPHPPIQGTPCVPSRRLS